MRRVLVFFWPLAAFGFAAGAWPPACQPWTAWAAIAAAGLGLMVWAETR